MIMGGGWDEIPTDLLMRIVSNVDDRTVISVCGVCTDWRSAISLGLRRLSLSWCNKNMNSLVISISPLLVNLQVLNLRQNVPQLQDDAILSISRYCHDLRELDLSRSFMLGDCSLQALAHGCQRLTKLNLSGCLNFSDSALAYLSQFCKNLKHLNLCGCGKAVSDRALQVVAVNCNQLQTLNLGWCENVSDKGIVSLGTNCYDLRTLDLCGCILTTDESVVALAMGCPHLKSLGLYYCRNITDRAMYSLANLLGTKTREQRQRQGWNVQGGLLSLNIGQCTGLTPPAVQAVCDSFPALHTCPGRHSLNISGCLSLTSVHCSCRMRSHPGTVLQSNFAY